MELIDVKCPNCGAALKIDYSKNKAFCQYCGTELHIETKEKIIKPEDAENIGYQFEKGRKRAEREGNRRRLPIIVVLLIIVTISVFFVAKTKSATMHETIATSSTPDSNSVISSENTSEGNTNSQNGNPNNTFAINNDSSEKFSDSDFAVQVDEYESGDSTYYFFIIQNKTEKQVLFNVTATAYDAAGNAIDVAVPNKTISGPGETGFIYLYFSRGDIDHIEYEMSHREPKVSYSVANSVEKKVTINKDSIIVTIKNNYSAPLNVFHVYVLFRNGDGVIAGYCDAYFSTEDLEPGKSVSGKISCPNQSCNAFTEQGNIEYYYVLLTPYNY